MSFWIVFFNYFFKIGPLWRPALELNGLPCVNKVLLYFSLLYFVQGVFSKQT